MSESPSPPPETSIDDVKKFALNEDWIATIIGLVVVLLAVSGVITEGWLPL